jgi:hypothetical protein
LFIEFQHPDYPALFTLNESDWFDPETSTTYISCKRKYLEYKDPAEHTFATAVFGSYQCWKAVCASPDLIPYITLWREELELLLRSEALATLRDRAAHGDVAAAKALASGAAKDAHKLKPSKQTEVRSAGRPRKTGPVPDHSDEHELAWKRLHPTVPTVVDSYRVTYTDNTQEDIVN